MSTAQDAGRAVTTALNDRQQNRAVALAEAREILGDVSVSELVEAAGWIALGLALIEVPGDEPAPSTDQSLQG